LVYAGRFAAISWTAPQCSKLGDLHAAELFHPLDRRTRDLLHRRRGREIDKIDGFLLLFEQPVAGDRARRRREPPSRRLRRRLAAGRAARIRRGARAQAERRVEPGFARNAFRLIAVWPATGPAGA